MENSVGIDPPVERITPSSATLLVSDSNSLLNALGYSVAAPSCVNSQIFIGDNQYLRHQCPLARNSDLPPPSHLPVNEVVPSKESLRVS